MKSIRTFIISCLLLSPILSLAEDNLTPPAASDSDVLLTNLGAYLGFDLTGSQNVIPDPYSALFDVTSTGSLLQNALLSVLGAIPVNAINEALSAFVPPNETYKGIAALNDQSNKTFEVAKFNSPDASSVSVNVLIDQENYQNDPINQAVLNILGTPDYTYCMNNDKTAWLSDCDYLYNMNVMSNIVGTLPTVKNFFSYAYNEAVLPQLNSNSLVGPLLYDTTTAATSGSSNSTTTDTSKGLTATNQIQEAANFIRYATFGVTPLKLPSQQEYSDAYATAISTDTTVSLADKTNAQNGIMNYLTSLRSYAAQSSVPISNLYYILSKRMPQPTTENNASGSQALSEFMMATRRLNTAGAQGGTPWINQINTASPTTVSKEIAILLAEINYQLYLNRQQQERQLLTESLMLMIALRQQAPDLGSSTTQASADNTTISE